MKIEERKLAEIRPYDNNPRVNDGAVSTVAASIREFGFRQPIVIDVEGVIICGHTRFKAAQKLGLEKVPVQPPEEPHLPKVSNSLASSSKATAARSASVRGTSASSEIACAKSPAATAACRYGERTADGVDG